MNDLKSLTIELLKFCRRGKAWREVERVLYFICLQALVKVDLNYEKVQYFPLLKYSAIVRSWSIFWNYLEFKIEFRVVIHWFTSLKFNALNLILISFHAKCISFHKLSKFVQLIKRALFKIEGTFLESFLIKHKFKLNQIFLEKQAFRGNFNLFHPRSTELFKPISSLFTSCLLTTSDNNGSFHEDFSLVFVGVCWCFSCNRKWKLIEVVGRIHIVC